MANENDKKCPMDCARCSFRQNVYCSAQIGLSSYEAITRLAQRIDGLEGKINDILGRADSLIEKLDALQADMLLEPMAQEREEAQTIDSQDNQKEVEK